MSLACVCSERCLAFFSLNRADRPAGETHRLKHLCIAGIGIGDGIALYDRLVGRLGEPFGHQLSCDCKNDQHEGAGERQSAKPGMQEVDEYEIDRHPRQVEQRNRSLAAQETAHRVNVPATLQRLGGRKAEAWHVDGHLMG